MELEELKTNWFVLNERLAKNEILNKRIIKEMITKRTRSAYSKLLGYNVFGLVVILVVGVWMGFSFVLMKGLMPLPFLIIGEIAFFFSGIWQVVKLRILNRFRFDQDTVYELSLRVLKFKLLQKREFIVSTIGVCPLLAVLIFLTPAPQFSIGTKILFFLVSAVFTVIIAYISYLYVEKRYMEAIGKGLNELKELEEEMEK